MTPKSLGSEAPQIHGLREWVALTPAAGPWNVAKPC
jgi:hypothetical protein